MQTEKLLQPRLYCRSGADYCYHFNYRLVNKIIIFCFSILINVHKIRSILYNITDIHKSEDDIRHSICYLFKTASEYSMELSIVSLCNQNPWGFPGW